MAALFLGELARLFLAALASMVLFHQYGALRRGNCTQLSCVLALLLPRSWQHRFSANSTSNASVLYREQGTENWERTALLLLCQVC